MYKSGNHTLSVDIQKDLNDWAYDMLTKEGFEKIKKDDALRQYCNLVMRLLDVKPRRIKKAKEFSCPKSQDIPMRVFENAVRSGFKLTHFMSKTIIDASFSDKLINDWGIYHFHLSTGIDDKDTRFMGRGDYLLLAYVDPYDDNTMYFLKTTPHKNMNWSEQDLIRIMADNWPEMMERYRLRGVDSLTKTISDEEYSTLRKNNINAAVDLHDGRIFIGPNVGLAGDGSSVRAGLNYNRMMNDAARMQLSIGENVRIICETIDQAFVDPERDYILSLVKPGIGKYVFSINGFTAFIGLCIERNNRFNIAVSESEALIEQRFTESLVPGT